MYAASALRNSRQLGFPSLDSRCDDNEFPAGGNKTVLYTTWIKEKVRKSSITNFVFIAALAAAIPAHGAEQLGKVKFATSCDPAVQEQFERGVAMLHSFWISAAQKTFREVVEKDPSCVIARWGFASILMSNPLAGQGASPKGAALAQTAIEQGRKIGAKTERERQMARAKA